MIDVDVGRQEVAAVAAELAAHRLGERLAGDLHLAGGEHVLARDEARAVDGRGDRRRRAARVGAAVGRGVGHAERWRAAGGDRDQRAPEDELHGARE